MAEPRHRVVAGEDVEHADGNRLGDDVPRRNGNALRVAQGAPQQELEVGAPRHGALALLSRNADLSEIDVNQADAFDGNDGTRAGVRSGRELCQHQEDYRAEGEHAGDAVEVGHPAQIGLGGGTQYRTGIAAPARRRALATAFA